MKILQKTCLVCKKLFQKSSTESMKNWFVRRKYCSKKCTDDSPRTKETRTKQRIIKIGKPSWNKGKHLSEAHKKALRKKHKPLSIETRKKMSLYRKGRKLPLLWRINISLGQKGSKGSNWQGGLTPIYETIRHSMEYREWRRKVYERDNYTCIECNKRGGKLNADHIQPFSIFPELRFEISNGRTLCVPCHRKTDTWGVNHRRIKNRNNFAKNTNAA